MGVTFDNYPPEGWTMDVWHEAGWRAGDLLFNGDRGIWYFGPVDSGVCLSSAELRQIADKLDELGYEP